jgi:hypothetical protein
VERISEGKPVSVKLARIIIDIVTHMAPERQWLGTATTKDPTKQTEDFHHGSSSKQPNNPLKNGLLQVYFPKLVLCAARACLSSQLHGDLSVAYFYCHLSGKESSRKLVRISSSGANTMRMLTFLICSLSFSISFAQNMWTVSSTIDEMTEVKSWYAASPITQPTKSMEFPYGDTKARLVIGLSEGKELAYVQFNTSPNLTDKNTKDGYDLINARIKFNDTILGISFIQNWGDKTLFFLEMDTQKVITQLMTANTVLLELNWYGIGKTRFRFPMRGAGDAIKAVFEKYPGKTIKQIDVGEKTGFTYHYVNSVSIKINEHRHEIDACYKKIAKNNPNVKGEITVRFSVTSEGKTTGIKIVKNTLNNINIERCIVQKIRDWQDFPRVHNSESDLVMEKTYSF